MKKLILTLSLGIATVSAFADAQFNAVNSGSASPVLAEGGLVKQLKLNGRAELFFGGTLLNTAKNTFALDGIFSFGVLNVVGKNSGDVVSITLNVWDVTAGATYAAALGAQHGYATTSFDVILASGSTPVNKIDAFKGITLASPPTNIPEPSTIALGVLGLGGLFFVSRRK